MTVTPIAIRNCRRIASDQSREVDPVNMPCTDKLGLGKENLKAMPEIVEGPGAAAAFPFIREECRCHSVSGASCAGSLYGLALEGCCELAESIALSKASDILKRHECGQFD